MLSALWVFTCSIAQANYTTIGLVSSNRAPSSFHRNPMVTGTSVLGVKFTGGVVIAADMLGSYGSLARFRNISRLMKVMPPPAEVSRPTACFSNFNIGVSSTGEQQHHPGSLGRLRRLPTPETGHRADGVSARTHTHTYVSVHTHIHTLVHPPSHLTGVVFRQYRWGVARWRAQLQPKGRALVAHPRHVQPPQPHEPTVEYRSHRRLLQRGEVRLGVVGVRPVKLHSYLLPPVF